MKIIRSQLWPALFVCALSLSVVAQPDLSASSKSQPSDLATHMRRLEKDFFRNFFRDEQRIWASPLRLRKRDLHWVLPLALTTAVLLPTDRSTMNVVRARTQIYPEQIKASRAVSRFGAPESTFGLAGSLYLIGRWTNHDRMRETGLLGATALVHSSLVIGALKFGTNRQRPDEGNGRGRFWAGGRSFPSGHAGTSFALATVIANEYRNQPLIRWGAYGAATAISISRVSGLKHYPSDIVVGGALGYLIGRMVVRERAASTASGGTKTTLYPYVHPLTQARGFGLSLSF